VKVPLETDAVGIGKAEPRRFTSRHPQQLSELPCHRPSAVGIRLISGFLARNRHEPLWGMHRFLRVVLSSVMIVSAWNGAMAQVIEEKQIVRLPVIAGGAAHFTRISTSDGLSQTRVAQIVQDDRGFMWFGTQCGLDRYDGYEFRSFVHDPRRSSSLSGVYIGSLLKDRSGVLWVGSAETVDRFDPMSETFKHFRIDEDKPEGTVGTVAGISQGQDGLLWIATGSGLHCLNPSSGQMTHYRHNPADASSLNSNDIKSSGEDKQGAFWVSTNNGLDEFDRKTGRVTLHIPLPESIFTSFYEDRLGTFWVYYTSGNGLAVLDRKTKKLIHYQFSDADPSSTALTGVNTMLEDHEGNLWIGSAVDGLLKYDRKGQRFLQYRNDPKDPGSLAEDNVASLCEDREGNIWTGLQSMGPNHFNPKPSKFEVFRHEPGNLNSLDATLVNAIYEDHLGTLWVGTDGGLTRIDRKKGRYTRFSNGLGERPMVVTIVEDPSGVLWVGTFGHGVARLDKETGQFKTYAYDANNPSSLSNNQVHRLFVDHNGIMWVATEDGLNRFDVASERFKTFKIDWHSIHSQCFCTITEDRNGIFWLGSDFSGLDRFDPATGEFTIYHSDPKLSGSLSDNLVSSVHIDRSGVLWVGTQFGLDRFDRETGRFTVYYEEDGMASNSVYSMLEDERGNLWMAGNKGLSMFDPLRKAFRNYRYFDGLEGIDLSGWGDTGFKASNGEMFFGGFSGAIAFFPSHVTENPDITSTVLTDFRLSNASIQVGTEPLLTHAIGFSDGLALTHQQNSLSLTFSALSFSNPPGNRYRYRLEGFERDWIQADSRRRQAAYTTLPAGNYTFRVQGATATGTWGEPGVVLPITILPAWWETMWFRGATGVGIFGAVYALYRVRIKALEDREKELRKLAAERRKAEDFLRLSQEKLAHVSRVMTVGELAASIAHEVNQPLAAVITNADACLRWLDRESPNLQEVSDALHRIVRDGNRGSDVISRIRALLKNEPLPKTELDLNMVIREIIEVVKHSLKGVVVELSLEEGIPSVLGDKIQLQQVLLNLIVNAIDAMRPADIQYRMLRIHSRHHNERELLIAVEDSGMGLGSEQNNKLFEAFYTNKPGGLGLGLSICRSVIERHGGRLWAEANKGPGATFIFTLPISAGTPL
jgi:signal transduction histidine kinase/ligand-binding sensor domain-containing protein